MKYENFIQAPLHELLPICVIFEHDTNLAFEIGLLLVMRKDLVLLVLKYILCCCFFIL